MYLFGFVVEHVFQLIDIGLLLCRDKDAVVVHFRHPCSLEVFETHVFPCRGSQVVELLRLVAECVYLVEDKYHRLLPGSADFVESLLYDRYLLFKLRMTHIHHMKQQIRVPDFVERGLERFHEVCGKFAYEAYGVGEQEGKIVDRHFSHSSVESGEKLVLGKYVAFAQRFISVDFPTLV